MTDADLLSVFMREPFGGFNPDVYASMTDWQLLHCILAARDRDGTLIPIKQRIADLPMLDRLRNRIEADPPPLETLNIPDEARALMPPNMPGGFIGMYWQRLLKVGFTQEAILERWKAYAAKGF